MSIPSHPGEVHSNRLRESIDASEPRSQRTFTPSLAVITHSAGIYHWTADNRRMYDFTSGVLVANLGHNSRAWQRRFESYLGWQQRDHSDHGGYIHAAPMSAYNALTPVEVEASRRLIELLQSSPFGSRMERVLWAASGSEAIQKSLWAAMARDRSRDLIIATRFGFHGKKGLANAVTGCETDRDRDPRVHFISFPMDECTDVSLRDREFDPTPYQGELDQLKMKHAQQIGTLITEPYLGGSGSYHPSAQYLQLIQQFCRDNDIVFILDEVQSNFGRTGRMFAFESYGIEPDLVVLGKGLGNGVPVAAVAGRRDILDSLNYGEASDTWSANPLSCAAVLATLDEFAASDVLGNCRQSSAVIEDRIVQLKKLPFIAHVRGERGGMVWGVETCDYGGRSAADWANEFVLRCYRGIDGHGIHLLGPLAKKVIRIAPPLIISIDEANAAMDLMHQILASLPDRRIAK